MVKGKRTFCGVKLFGFAAAAFTLFASVDGHAAEQTLRDLHSVKDAIDIRNEIQKLTEDQLPGRSLTSTQELPIGRGLSPRPWFQEVVDRYGAPPRQHPQRYSGDGRRLSVLAENNTAPIRIHLNFDTLYKDKVQANPFTKDRYCFREGEWFRHGHPGEKPSGNGPDDCGDRTVTFISGDKWCLCTANDLITERVRDFVIHATTEVMKEVPQFFSVKPLEESLKFRNFEGSYPAMWQTTGQTGECCDPDCQKGMHVVVPDSLCDGGVAADAVLSVSMPPPLPGVGGAATYCSADQHGRPAHLVFQWHRRITDAEFAYSSTEELVQQWRGLVLHEAFHGLGFGSSLWRNRYDADGQRLDIIKQLEVEDDDGHKDSVYHFVKGTRTYDVAKVYFACEEDDQWQGLPLMSWPPSGRDTHHETRIMRDDVMSYGDGLQAVSAITMAALEDTGYYLANYSAAECMWWGKGRGCSFVLRRCTARPEGAVVTGDEVSSLCDRTWSTRYSSGNRQALERCIQPSCQSRSALGVTTCDLECFTGEDTTSTCKQAPTTEVEAAGVVGWVEDIAQKVSQYDVTYESLKSVATMCMGPILFLSVCCVARCMLCRGGKMQAARMRGLFYILSGISLLPGIGIFAFGLYVALNWNELQVFFSVEFIAGLQGLGLGVFFITGFGIFSVYSQHRKKQLCFCLLRSLEVLTLGGLVALAAKFAMDLDNMTADTMSQAGVATTDVTSFGFAQRMADHVMNEMLSLSCRTYQVCCEDTELLDLRVANGAPRQCKVAHEGMQEDVGLILSDPSHLEFCPSVSGVNSRTAFPPFICSWIQTGDFTIEGCKQAYCTSGLQGLQNFLSAGVTVYRENMLNCGLGVSFLLAVQLVQLFIVLCTRTRTRLSRVAADGDSLESDDDLQTIVPAQRGTGITQVKTVTVKAKRLERRISVGSDLAFTSTYTGPTAASKKKPGR